MRDGEGGLAQWETDAFELFYPHGWRICEEVVLYQHGPEQASCFSRDNLQHSIHPTTKRSGQRYKEKHLLQSFISFSISGNPDSSALYWSTPVCRKLDPKWVPERAKHSGRKIWHEMKGPWRLSPIEHNPKITNLFSRRAFLVTPRWWRSTWRFPITDHSWNVDIHARKSKRGRRANVKSNNSRQISQVK